MIARENNETICNEQRCNEYKFLRAFYAEAWEQKEVSTDTIYNWTKRAEKESGYDSDGEKIVSYD